MAGAMTVMMLALSAPASAATYCVDIAVTGCDFVGPSYSGAAGLQNALNGAAGTTLGDDTVRVGASTYTGQFTYQPAGSTGALAIIGAGPDFTTLAAPGGGGTALKLRRDPLGGAANVSNLSVRLPAANAVFSGIDTDSLADNVRVSAAFNSTGNYFGVQLSGAGGQLRGSTVDLANTSQAIGVYVPQGVSGGTSPSVDTSTLRNALIPLEVFSAVHVTRSTLSGANVNRALLAAGAAVTIDDSLVAVSGGSGLSAEPLLGRVGSVLARHTTVVSVGATAAFAGLDVDTSGETVDASIDVRSSIVRGFTNGSFRRAASGTRASVSLSGSDYSFGRDRIAGSGDTTLSQPQPNIDADPLFRDPSGDYSLKDGSPAIDAAYSPALSADEPAVDLPGNPRILDGNGDGVAARDMGAYEHATVPGPSPPPPGPPPPVPPSRPVPSNALTITAVHTDKKGKLTVTGRNGSGGTDTARAATTRTGKLPIAGRKPKPIRYGIASTTTPGPGRFKIGITPTAAAKRLLIKRGHLRVAVSVTFHPLGGTRRTKTVNVNVKVRKKRQRGR